MTRPLNLAHRGASGDAPENTLASIRLAEKLGADGIEIDVHLSRDGQVVLMHDDTLERTTSGTGRVDQWDLRELQKLDAGSWFSLAYAREPIPTLQQVLTWASDHFFINVEIKADTDLAQLAVAVVDLMEHTRCYCVITSFDSRALQEVQKLTAQIPLGLIFEHDRENALAAEWPILSVYYPLVDAEYLARCRKKNKTVFVWTVDEIWEMEKLCHLGVAAIMTNYPDRLASLRFD